MVSEHRLFTSSLLSRERSVLPEDCIFHWPENAIQISCILVFSSLIFICPLVCSILLFMDFF